MKEQKSYREDLLDWCQTVELKLDSMKPRFSKLIDLESRIMEWEESCRQLLVKLQEDIKAVNEDYETANRLNEQFEQLYRESISNKAAMEVDSENRLEMKGQIQIDEEYLETNADQVEMEIESEQYIDMEELNQYREDLLKWCNNLYSNWNRTKPRLSNLVDNVTLEGWEGMCTRLIVKLQENLSLDYEDYETANRLYEQWENLLDESYSDQKEIEVG